MSDALSGLASVPVVQAAHVGDGDDLVADFGRLDSARCGRVLPKTEMAPAFVVVALVRIQHPLQVPLAQRNHMVCAFSADRAHDSLQEGPPRDRPVQGVACSWSRPPQRQTPSADPRANPGRGAGTQLPAAPPHAQDGRQAHGYRGGLAQNNIDHFNTYPVQRIELELFTRNRMVMLRHSHKEPERSLCSIDGFHHWGATRRSAAGWLADPCR